MSNLNAAICSIKDNTANVFGPIHCTRSTGEAIRSFSTEVNRRDEKNLLFMHPHDFVLYHLGHFDQVSGAICLLDVPVVLVRAADVLEDKKIASVPPVLNRDYEYMPAN